MEAVESGLLLVGNSYSAKPAVLAIDYGFFLFRLIDHSWLLKPGLSDRIGLLLVGNSLPKPGLEPYLGGSIFLVRPVGDQL